MSIKTKTLLIGCGGSGIATLLRLNELMASKEDFREDMKESIFYYVLDTAAGDVLGDPGQKKPGFKEIIAAQMGDVRAPFALPVHLTEGYHQVSEMLGDSFYAKDGTAGKMKNFWWYNTKGQPFTGKWINNPEQGAAQCPQVSYLAAWNHLPQIESDIKTVLHAIESSNAERGALSKLNVYIVAGLAGGTGRGCWNLVAFKIRQCLLEEGVTVPMDAILFDGSCYPNVGEPDQKEGMAFNSVTGLSELSAWFHMSKGLLPENGKPPFELPLTMPSLENPSTDAINFHAFQTPDGLPPQLLQSAYVVFGENGFTPHLEDNKQYHEMAAAALYAKIVNAAEIGEREINQRFEIGSFASTTFEVDSARIQAYLQTAAQKAFLERQYADRDVKRSAAEAAAAVSFVGANFPESESAPAKESFLGRSHLWIPGKLLCEDSCNSFDYKQSQQKTLLQTMMELLAENNSLLAYVQRKDEKAKPIGEPELGLTVKFRGDTALASDNVDTVMSFVAKALELEEELRDDEIKDCFKTILAAENLAGENLRSTLHQLVLDQFAHGGKSVSLHRAQCFTQALREAFSENVKKLSDKVTVEIDGKSYNGAIGEGGLVPGFQQEIQSRSGRNFENWRVKHFTTGEIDDLCHKFDYFVQAAVFFRMRSILQEFFEQAVGALDEILEHLRAMAKYFQQANKALEVNLEPVFGENLDYDKLFDELFTDSGKPSAVQAALPDPEALESRFYRQLKPILSRTDLYNLLTDENNIYVDTDEVMTCIQKQLQNLLDGAYSTPTVAAINIQKEISTVLTQRVMVRPEFCREFCSFEAVLKLNVNAWNVLLSRTTIGLGTLKDRFTAYLGLEPDDLEKNPETGKREVILEDVLKQKMVCSLVLNCNPWLVLQPEVQKSKRPAECLVILPFALDSKTELALKNSIKLLFGVKTDDNSWAPTILHTGSSKTNGIPLNRILVYTSNGLPVKKDKDNVPDGVYLDWVAPLMKYCNRNANAELLRQAENQDGAAAALFSSSGVERDRTFAFLAPFFTSEYFRDMRWHPWLKKDQK